MAIPGSGKVAVAEKIRYPHSGPSPHGIGLTLPSPLGPQSIVYPWICNGKELQQAHSELKKSG